MADGRAGIPGSILGLMVVNLGVYVLWHTVGLQDPVLMRDHFVVSLEAMRAGRVWTLLGSTVSHYDATHLLVNMIALWAFGTPVARLLGAQRFIALYVAGGFVASLAHLGWSLLAGTEAGALGASGAVGAIAAVFALWFPQATLLVMFLIPMPAWLAVIGFLLLDVLGVLGGGVDPWGRPVAHAAHLGGAAVGLVAGLPGAIRFRRAQAERSRRR